jgi:uncharacterized Zn-binding protein involved in type VI secretion
MKYVIDDLGNQVIDDSGNQVVASIRTIALLGDPSDHGGIVTTSNQDGTLILVVQDIQGGPSSGLMYADFEFGGFAEESNVSNGTEVAVEGASHRCPIIGHGTTTITAVTTKSYHNGKLILTEDAVAGCGARLVPPDRSVYVE